MDGVSDTATEATWALSGVRIFTYDKIAMMIDATPNEEQEGKRREGKEEPKQTIDMRSGRKR